MKKVFLMVIVAVIAMVAVVTTGCNKYREAYIESGLELARDFGCMTWDVHYYGYNNYDMAELEREIMKNNGVVCTKIENNGSTYWFKTLNSRV